MTQVVSADQGEIFHNRLTHSLEVAQIARRLAERVRELQPDEAKALEVDPDVAEAAALAHDLGHPPFGHIAELELQDLLDKHKLADGFEGNAQSFRVVTRLAVRTGTYPGLDLTRATLSAILKYPWHRHSTFNIGLKRGSQEKWGAYETEKDDFDWARQSAPAGIKSVEAEIMDWADDIAYAVHDVEDFYRAGFIPLDRLTEFAEMDTFAKEVFDRWDRDGKTVPANYASDFSELFTIAPKLNGPYRGGSSQRAALRQLTSFLINRYLGAFTLRIPTAADKRTVEIDTDLKLENSLLKELTWHYVILNDALVTQQFGQRKIIRDLFEIYCDAANTSASARSAAAWRRKVLPGDYGETLKLLEETKMGHQLEQAKIRMAVDIVAGLSEKQAIDMHRRLTGMESGSVLNAIIR